MKIKYGILIFCVFGLAGCASSHSGPGGLHNIKWYKAHPKITSKEIKWCNSKAPRKYEMVCQNATTAMDYIQVHNFLSPPKGGFVAGGSDGRIVAP